MQHKNSHKENEASGIALPFLIEGIKNLWDQKYIWIATTKQQMKISKSIKLKGKDKRYLKQTNRTHTITRTTIT